jgi:Xaa-Pro aminopeptidase
MARSARLITNASNLRYLTDFVAPADALEAVLIESGRTACLITHGMNRQQADTVAARHPGMTTRIIGSMHDLPEAIRDVLTSARATRLEIEYGSVTHALYEQLRETLAPAVTMTSLTRPVETKRLIKSAAELTKIRKACAVSDDCYSAMLPRIRPGVTEGELCWEIEAFFRKRGAVSAFTPIVAFGAHASVPHYSAASSTAKLGRNDTVLLDFGAAVEGYASDITRCVAVGTPSAEWREAYAAVLAAQEAALTYLSSAVRPSGQAADAAARAVVAARGYPDYPHSLGHNLGLDIHESPRLTVKKAAAIKPDMTFTVEPGIYLDGRLGIRIEDTVRKTDTGLEILTRSPKTLTVLP